MDSPHSIGVRFTIEEKDGQLSGRTFWEDPVTHQFEPEAEFTGTRSSHDASWTTGTGVAIAGKFQGDVFTGTLAFPADGDEPEHTTTLSLKR